MTAAILAWGVSSFGAVYPWAFWPLLASLLVLGGWMCFQGGARPRARVGVAAMLLILPGLFQLVPLPRGLLTSLASANVAFQDNFRLGAALAQDLSLHPISADPALTWLTFGFLFVGTVWVGGLSRSLHSHVEPRDIASWTVKIAVCVAVLALAQKATFNGKIYWFWESRFRESFNYFGPFVNRNHFAGWMLLALSLSAGYLAGQFSSAARRVKPGFREHLLWLGTPQASAILMTSASLLVMAVSLVWTMSRSGIAATSVAAVLLLVALIGRRQGALPRRGFAGAVVVFGLGGAMAWKGVDRLGTWYGDTATLEWRLTLWRDTMAPLKDFWLLGSGLNTYGTVMLLYPQTDTATHAQRAHNDYLQLAVEGGLLVCIPVLIAIVLLARLMWRRLHQPQDEMTWWIRMGAIAGICGMAIQEISDFSLQIPGVALLFATCVAIAIHEPAPAAASRSEHRERRRLKSKVSGEIYV